jgi:hypothetical protein
MLKKSIEKAFNEQINAETYSAYLYWSMSAWCEKHNLAGFANWMRVQAQEEMSHAMKFYTHILERGGEVKLTAIDGPETEWKDIEAMFAATLKHENYVTERITHWSIRPTRKRITPAINSCEVCQRAGGKREKCRADPGTAEDYGQTARCSPVYAGQGNGGPYLYAACGARGISPCV